MGMRNPTIVLLAKLAHALDTTASTCLTLSETCWMSY